jgi:uncharacterized protein YoaH (UPF0181 family)
MGDAIIKIAGDVSNLLGALTSGRLGLREFAGEVEGVGGSGAALGNSMTMSVAAGELLGRTLGDLARGALNLVKDAIKGVASEFIRGISLSNEYNTALTGLRAVAAGTGNDIGATEKAARDFASNGLMSVSSAATSLKNLLATGFSLPDAIRLMKAAGDSAAFNRQGMLSYGESVERFTQGIKFNNSALTDSTGLGKNLSVIMKEAGLSQDAAGRAANDAGVRQAILNGFLKEGALFTGNAAKYTETYGGQVARLSASYDSFLATLGDAVTKNQTVITVMGMVADAFKGAGTNMDLTRKIAGFVSDAIIFLVKSINPLLSALDFLQQAWYQGKVVMNLIDAALASIELQTERAALGLLRFITNLDPTGLAAKALAGNIKNLEANVAASNTRMVAAADAAAKNDSTWKENSATLVGWQKNIAGAVVQLEGTRGKLAEVTFETTNNTRETTKNVDTKSIAAKEEKKWQDEIAKLQFNLRGVEPTLANGALLTKEYGNTVEDVVNKSKLHGLQVPADIKKVYDAIQTYKLSQAFDKEVRVGMKGLDDWIKQTASNVEFNMIKGYGVAVDFEDKLTALQGDKSEQRIAQIERERKAELNKYTGPGFEQARAAINAYYNYQTELATGSQNTIVQRMASAGVLTRDELQKQADAATRDYNQMRASGVFTADQIYDAWKKMTDANKKANGDWLGQTQQMLGAVAGAFAQLGQITGGTFGAVTKGIGSMIGNVNTGLTGLDTMQKGLGALTSGNMLQGITGLASGFGAIASAVVGIGVPLVQGIAHMLGFRSEWEKITKDIARDYDVNVSQELAKKIEADSKKIGDRNAAILNNLAAVIKEAGGITTANVGTYTQKLHDVFSAVEAGTLTTKQASEQVAAVFPQLAKVIVDSNTLAGKSFTDLIRLDNDFGIKSAEVAAFVKSQITGVIVPGLNQWASAFTSANDTMTKNDTERAKLEGDLAKARTADEKAQIQARLAELTASNAAAQSILKATSVSTQAQATGLTETVAVTFQKLRAEGMSTGDAIKALQPTIDALRQQLDKAGLQGTNAFNQISDMAALAADKVAGPTLASVDGLDKAMRGLHNTGLLNDTMFDALSSSVTQAFNELKAQGKSSDTVMRSMQPTLQMLWEEQQKFGRTVDASTQDMLDQGVASGIIGSQYMSAQDKMAQSTAHLDAVISAMARTMGIDVPAAADEAARRTAGATDTMAYKINTGPNPAISDLQGRLSSTPWEAFAGRADDAGSKAALAVQRAAYAAQTAGTNVANSTAAWDTWAYRAGQAAQRVQQEVDAVSFGYSPGGIKEWVPMLTKAIGTFGALETNATKNLRGVKANIDTLKLPNMGNLSMPDLNTRAIADSYAGNRTITMPLTLQDSVIADPESMDWFVRNIQGRMAEQLGANVRVFVEG